MNVAILGLCRGNGKIYIKVSISNVNAPDSLTFFLQKNSEIPLPCNAYLFSQTQDEIVFIICLPILDIAQNLIIKENDSAGNTISEFSRKISPGYAKWKSRLDYRFKPELTNNIKDYDKRYKYDQISMRFWSCISDSPLNILHATMSVPYCSQLEDISIICLDASGNEVPLNPVFLGAEHYFPVKYSDSYINNVEISVRLPQALQNYCFIFKDESHPESNGFSVIEKEWYSTTINNTRKEMQSAQEDDRYHDWFFENRVQIADIKKQITVKFEIVPLFSIVVPLYKTPHDYFMMVVKSVLEQSYSNWELILVNASPEDTELTKAVKKFCDIDKRIKQVEQPKNAGISENTNAGIRHAQGDFICFLDHDDFIEPDLLFEYVCAINSDPDSDLLYCDEDKYDDKGKYFDPFFKPDFSIDLLRNNNYICHMLCIRKALLDEIGLLDSQCDGAQDHDLTLRAVEKTRSVTHVDKLLYHWRANTNSTAGNSENKSYATEAGIRAVKKHLERMKINAGVEISRRPFTYKVNYYPPENRPLVSIIIPNKDNTKILKTCLKSILEKSTYDNYEIIIVENNSAEEETFKYYKEIETDNRIQVIHHNDIFNFSCIVNKGVEVANGDYIILLNNDTEVITANWIERMLGISLRDDVGAVGVKLYYPDDTIQHAGISITPTVVARLHLSLPRNNWGYFALNDAEQNMSAVTAACMMLKRSSFEIVGGFTEELQVAFNDVDYCLKLREEGFLIVYTPEVELYHYESLSRGNENTKAKKLRFEQEIAYMRETWKKYYVCGDPYYNSNLSQFAPPSMYYGLNFENE